MSQLCVYREYSDETVILLRATAPWADNQRRFNAIREFPEAGIGEGFIYFELLNDQGDIDSDPVRVSRENSVDVLMHTGLSRSAARLMVSDQFAHVKLIEYYSNIGWEPRALEEVKHVPLDYTPGDGKTYKLRVAFLGAYAMNAESACAFCDGGRSTRLDQYVASRPFMVACPMCQGQG